MSLAQKFGVTACFLVVSVAAFFGLIITRYTESTMESELRQQSVIIAQYLKERSIPLILNYELWDLYTAVRDTVSKSADGSVVYAMALSPRGQILAHSEPGRFRLGDILESSPLNDTALHAVELYFQPMTSEAGDQIYDIAVPAMFEGKKIGVIRIGVTQKIMVQRLAILRKEIATITVVLACLGILVGIALSRRITKPLEQLSRTAYEIAAKGVIGVRRVVIKGKDEVGKLAESFNLMTDALEKSISELDRTKEYLMTLLEVANDFIYTLDQEGRFSYVNAKFADWGYSKRDLIGQSFVVILSDEHKGLRTQETLKEGHAQQYEAAMKDKHGNARAVLLSTTPLRDSEGNITGLLGIVKDVTLMKEMEAHLFEAEKLSSLGGMMLSLGHEINNPLGIIQGFVQELIEEGPFDPSHQFQIARIIEEEVLRCQQVLAGLLEFARPKPFKRESTDISNLLDRSLKLLSPLTKKQGVKVHLHIEHNLPRVFLDAHQFQQVLVNLYLNAIDAMPHGGELRVEAYLETRNGCSLASGNAGLPAQHLMIGVSDTGHGIAEEDICHVFEAFFSKKETEQQGTGLGLFLSKHIIKSHGGRIEVESLLGKETTFRIRLPVSEPSYIGSTCDGKDSDCR